MADPSDRPNHSLQCLLVLVILVTVMGACSGPSPTPEILVVTATFTPKPQILVVTATFTPEPEIKVVTATFTPTPEVVPSDTPLPAPTETPSPLPSPTSPPPTPTPVEPTAPPPTPIPTATPVPPSPTPIPTATRVPPSPAPKPTAKPATAPPPPAPSAAKGCYLIQNHLGADLTLTFTAQDWQWNDSFPIAANGEKEYCLDPGRYTYTIDAPPPWGVINGDIQANAGDRFLWPIRGQE